LGAQLLPAIQRQSHFLRLSFEMQHQFDIAKSMQQARMHNVHQMRKVQGAVRALGPTAIAAKEFSRAGVPQ
jgi:hypothetical protein